MGSRFSMTGSSLKATPLLGIRSGKVRLGFFKFFMGDLLADQLLETTANSMIANANAGPSPVN